ncbi:hypothetical protein [Candidatus Nitrotoga sp. M5]|uniref:hypothetical protein n=1 Tax=Candidatus Nitrotoga sp. M5 TaxID=2890409 RepID=UPI001EF214A6|nr:hypothetical protein [Candidatus Nitrotoga sp. M5]
MTTSLLRPSTFRAEADRQNRRAQHSIECAVPSLLRLVGKQFADVCGCRGHGAAAGGCEPLVEAPLYK